MAYSSRRTLIPGGNYSTASNGYLPYSAQAPIRIVGPWRIVGARVGGNSSGRVGGKVPGGRPETGVDVSDREGRRLLICRTKVPISLTSKALAGTLPSFCMGAKLLH
jgi:hypothetical protein